MHLRLRTIIFILLLIFIYFFIFKPVIKELSLCYTQGKEVLDQISKQIEEEGWPREKILQAAEETKQKMEDCKKRVSSKTGVPESIVQLIDWPARQKIKSVLEERGLKY